MTSLRVEFLGVFLFWTGQDGHCSRIVFFRDMSLSHPFATLFGQFGGDKLASWCFCGFLFWEQRYYAGTCEEGGLPIFSGAPLVFVHVLGGPLKSPEDMSPRGIATSKTFTCFAEACFPLGVTPTTSPLSSSDFRLKNMGTQHVIGTVSNEATNDMGYQCWPFRYLLRSSHFTSCFCTALPHQLAWCYGGENIKVLHSHNMMSTMSSLLLFDQHTVGDWEIAKSTAASQHDEYDE